MDTKAEKLVLPGMMGRVATNAGVAAGRDSDTDTIHAQMVPVYSRLVQFVVLIL